MEEFDTTPWMLSVERTVQPVGRLRLEVAYLQEKPALDVGPFDMQEQRLAEALVERMLSYLVRRHSARILREGDSLLHTMLQQTTDAVVLVDLADGSFRHFNTTAHESLGYTREEFGRLTVRDIQAEHNAERIGANIQAVLQGKQVGFETSHRHKDGGVRRVELTLRPVSHRGETLISAVWRDITVQRERETRQQELNDRLQLYHLILGELSGSAALIEGDRETFSRQATELVGRALGIHRVSIWLYDTPQRLPKLSR